MDHFIVWDTVSMAWTEIGLDDSDYPKIAKKLRQQYSSWEDVNDIILGDVLGFFALSSLAFLLILVPVLGMFMVAPFPDWGYDDVWMKNKMARWEKMKRWQHYLNPFRLAGYPLAYLFSMALRRRLRAAYMAAGCS